MRKTSQDGGDSTSITSGIENDIKKPGAIIKNKRSSIKRKVQNFSLESDDAVIEPLLQKDKEKTETAKQSAKFNLLSKAKTEPTSEKGTDKDKLISDDILQKAALSNVSDVTDRSLPTTNLKENSISKLTSANAPLHNHMNTNVFSNHDGLKTFVAPKSQILVEIDGSKHVGYNPSPLIFTTAKIHTDGKTKHMEPVQMTPVPILSTIEVSVMKSGINAGETSGHVTSNISAVYIPESNKNITEQDPKLPFKTINNTPTSQNKVIDTKNQMHTDKPDVKSNKLDKSSVASSSKNTKLIQPNFSPTSAKDNKIEKEEYHIKTHTSQPNSITLEKSKTIVPQEAKSEASFTTIKETNKIKESEIFDPAVITKNDTTDALRYPENKTDLNKTFKPVSLDLQRTKPSDNVNSSEKTSKDKTNDTTNISFSSRQLHRQNIVLDKDDPISKLNPSIVSPPLTNDSKDLLKNKSGDFQKPSTFEKNTLSDNTKITKSSANIIPITSVTSVSTNTSISETDNKIYASTTTAATFNKKPSPITSNAAINQTAASASNSAAKNNSPAAIPTSASVKETSFPTISFANKTFNPLTTTSNAKNICAPNKVAVPITTGTAIKTTSVSITNVAAVNKSFVPISTPNKTSAPITNIVAPNKVAVPSTSTTSGNKISSPSTSFATGKKTPSTTSTTAAADNKTSTPSTTTAASNKISAHSPFTTTGSKLSKPITTTAATSKISTTSITTATGNKISAPSCITTDGNKISTTTTAGNKISSPSSITIAGDKISSPSSITTAASKISSSSTTTKVGNKISSPSTSIAAGNKIPSTSTTNATGNKISAPSSTPSVGNKISASTTIYESDNKISSSSTTTTAATNKISGPVITTTAIEMASGSTTTPTGVDIITTSNSNSSNKPITSSSSTLLSFSRTPITKSAISTTFSASKPLNTEKYSSNAQTQGNIKYGTANETSTTKSRLTSTLNTKPTSLTTTTKPEKVSTVFGPTTTSQQTTVVKSPTVTTGKSAPTKTIPQPAIKKSTEITPKSSTRNDKPLTGKSNSSSISSTTTSGMSNVTSTSATLTSSGSSAAPAEVNKQSDSKSKVISNGSKSFKA